MTDIELYVNHISYPVTNLGPGKRLVLWLEGCPLNCNGCMASSMKYQRNEHKRTIEEVMLEIKIGSGNLDGITISGGEPFFQAVALLKLVQQIRESTSLDIMIYSGYKIEELTVMGDAVRSILDQIDILVDGRFEEQSSNVKLWRGSDNQRFIILSERAKKNIHFVDAEYEKNRELYYEMSANNQLRIIGIPERGFLKDIEKKLRDKGLGIL